MSRAHSGGGSKERNDKDPLFLGRGGFPDRISYSAPVPCWQEILETVRRRAERCMSADMIGGVSAPSSFSFFCLEVRLPLQDTRSVRVLLIDNTDSFTWNLAQQIRALGAECVVKGNDKITVGEIQKMKPDRIVLSPGPGGPESARVSLDILRELSESVPILGVCLGHQCMAHVFGGARFVTHANSVMHGKTSEVRHNGQGVFYGIPSPFSAARYHSLIVKKLPQDFELLAWSGSGEKKEIMAMKHKKLPVVGVQFHPESFLTKHGNTLMKNFLFRT